jgi:2-phospho-L-lactate transferase CofD-like protein
MKPSTSSAALRVVELGAGAMLPAMLRGIAEAFFAGTQRHGSLMLTSLNDLRRDPDRTAERAGDGSARQAIAAADLIVLGPGSVTMDLLPVLRVREIAEEIGRSRARVALVMNLMTEPGETDGYVASDCVLTIRQHAPEVPIHDVLLNDAPIRSDLLVSYARQGSLPLGYDTEALEALGCRPLRCDLLCDGPVVRHDPRKVGRAFLGLMADAGTRARDRPRVRAAQSVTEAFV